MLVELQRLETYEGLMLVNEASSSIWVIFEKHWYYAVYETE